MIPDAPQDRADAPSSSTPAPAAALRQTLRRAQALLATTPELLAPVTDAMAQLQQQASPEPDTPLAAEPGRAARLALSATLGVTLLLGATGCASEDPAQRSLREACDAGRTQDGWVVVDDRKCEQVVRSHGGVFPHYYYYHYYSGGSYYGTPSVSGARATGGLGGGAAERILTPSRIGASDYDLARRQVGVAPEPMVRGRGGVEGPSVGRTLGRVQGRAFGLGRSSPTVGRSAFRMSAGRSFVS